MKVLWEIARYEYRRNVFKKSFILLAVYYTLRTAAAMFHTRNLLSGQPFSARHYMGALIGRPSSRS